MISALDASVLIAVAKQESNADRWIDLLIRCRADGELVACEVAVAETFAYVRHQGDLQSLMWGLGVRFDAVSMPAAMLAGSIFADYRRLGGPRPHLIPDFIIAAHASVQAQRLLSTDRGFTRRYFPRLKLLSP